MSALFYTLTPADEKRLIHAARARREARRRQLKEQIMELTKRVFADGRVTMYHADCRDVLPTLGQVDAVITDPPYGISFAAQPTTGGRKRGQKAETWDDETPTEVVLKLATLAPLCVIWGGNYYPLPCTRGWLMWRKPDAPPSMAHGELAWTNVDQNLRVIDWSISATNPERVGHPTQKPVRVMSWSMEQVGVPDGASVLDPFAGSGTTAIACIRTGRRFIGIEKDATHFATACERIEQELAQGDLFMKGGAVCT